MTLGIGKQRRKKPIISCMPWLKNMCSITWRKKSPRTRAETAVAKAAEAALSAAALAEAAVTEAAAAAPEIQQMTDDQPPVSPLGPALQNEVRLSPVSIGKQIFKRVSDIRFILPMYIIATAMPEITAALVFGCVLRAFILGGKETNLEGSPLPPPEETTIKECLELTQAAQSPSQAEVQPAPQTDTQPTPQRDAQSASQGEAQPAPQTDTQPNTKCLPIKEVYHMLIKCWLREKKSPQASSSPPLSPSSVLENTE